MRTVHTCLEYVFTVPVRLGAKRADDVDCRVELVKVIGNASPQLFFNSLLQ